jgi:calcium-dependent channel (putative phosphate transporter)
MTVCLTVLVLQELQQANGMGWLKHVTGVHPVLTGILEGLLPAVAMVILMMVTIKLMWRMSQEEGHVSGVDLEVSHIFHYTRKCSSGVVWRLQLYCVLLQGSREMDGNQISRLRIHCSVSHHR